jgi:peptidoglycan/LPS O-acetylase OafA/YrhL
MLLGGPLTGIVAPFAQQGFVGVSFFFILSGFVLTWSRRPDDTATSFYRRRFARIYPSHLLTWVLGVLLVVFVVPREPSILGCALGVGLLQAWSPDANVNYAANGVAWSLSAEFFFYATFPLYINRLSAMSRRWRLILAVAVGAVVPVMAWLSGPHLASAALAGNSDGGLWLWLLYGCPLIRAAEFLLGVVLAIEVRNGFRLGGFRWWLAASGVTYMVAGIFLTSFSPAAITLVPFCAVIVAAASSDLTGRSSIFARPTFVKLGQWSFAFYLVHQLVIRVVVARLGVVVDPVVAAVLVVVTLVLALNIAGAVHMLVETPANRALVRAFDRRRRLGQSTVSAPDSRGEPAPSPAA